ncbi:MAG: EAL domain-containing protein [Nitrospirae bacterium]|nr:EAL domain-containing protein [Nitrospirota bacterium]
MRKAGTDRKDLTTLRREAEKKLQERTGRLHELSTQDIRRLVHELGTFQIELEMQNEELRRAQEELRRSLAREQAARAEAEEGRRILDAVMEYVPEGITIADAPDVNIRIVSKYGVHLVGHPKEIIEHIPAESHPEVWQIFHPDGVTLAAPDELPLTRAVKRGAVVADEEWIVRRPDGKNILILCNAGPIRDSEGNIAGGVMAWRDITERKQMEEAMRYQAYHDILTDLPNRMLFMDHLALELNQARRNRTALAVMFLDLDYFKNINDTLGHSVGDQLLKEVAGRLKACVRESDTVARIGGDEFNILLPDIAHTEYVAAIAKKINSIFKRPFIIENHELHVTTSIGISIYPEDGGDSEPLLKNADIAMYHAKEGGRNNYQFYNPIMNIRSIERMTLENSLHRMIEHGELVLYYQPQLDIGSRKIISAEALVRWQHPELGLLSPAQFIPLAEEMGLITPIDEWVLHTACAQNRVWQKAGYPPMRVTVNLSAQRFQQPNFVDTISHVLYETSLKPELLELEITESTAMQNINLTIDNLSRLAGMGIRVTMDDFGAGCSSLGHLKKMPVKKLKIDRYFIRSLTTDPDYRAIVNAVISMAHNLDLGVVAEGVETNDQLSFLSSSHCDEMQGYLFSKPLPADRFEKMIMVHR